MLALQKSLSPVTYETSHIILLDLVQLGVFAMAVVGFLFTHICLLDGGLLEWDCLLFPNNGMFVLSPFHVHLDCGFELHTRKQL